MLSVLRVIRRRYFAGPMVRPWALAVPVLVLLVCLPLLRPLRHPDPREVSDDERARLATVQALVEYRTQAIDDVWIAPRARQTIEVGDYTYADQPPTMAFLLAGPYWIMQRNGLTMDANPTLVPYLLTVLGVTLPIAGAAGLIYRMGRLFELRRPIRTALAAAVVLGTGLISYGVVLNAHAPAAALVLGAAGCLIHVAVSKRPMVGSGWLVLAGMCAALAAAIEPAAIVFMVLLGLIPLTLRWRPSARIGGVLLYVIGLTPPLALHASLTVPITGDVLPGMFHPELARSGASDWHLFALGPPTSATNPAAAGPAPGAAGLPRGDAVDPFDVVVTDSAWDAIGRGISRVMNVLVGSHGVLSHFPVLVVGVLGVFAVMHRHWPFSTKALAAASGIGAAIVLLVFALGTPARAGAMFGARWFVVFLPLLGFWAGAWLRRHHHPVAWGAAGVALAFSVVVSLIGATDPFPRNGYARYSAAEAVAKLFRADADRVSEGPIVAGREHDAAARLPGPPSPSRVPAQREVEGRG